jgi:MoxR-like ATPase
MPKIAANIAQQTSNIQHNDLQKANDIITRIKNIFSQRVIGQESLWTSMMLTLIADGHILIESVPGLAKTTAAEVLCAAIQGKFSRIQCTPDLMPSDIVGSQIYNYGTGKFSTQLGPVHANLVLLDEINRSSAKTQSAMLEAMQERQTTIGEKSYPLPPQFMVIATQNPIEEEGTYQLPEAQMDRFLLKEIITYPTPEEEVKILNNVVEGKFDAPLRGYIVSLEDIKYVQDLSKQVFVSPTIIHYIVSLISTSRGGGPNPIVGLDKLVRVGASPRASIAFIRVCQALALLQGRGYVIPEDVRDVRYSVLRHRILRTFDAMAEDVMVETIIDRIFQVVPVP